MRYDIVAIVAAARGVMPMRRLLERLPADLAVPVVCLAEGNATLPVQIAAETRLDLRTVHPGDRIEAGCVYFAPPGTTPLVVEGRAITLAPYGPESAALQPQDHFLGSIAAQYGARALVVVLGNFDGDGVAGARAIKERGGTVLVLDRGTAAHWGMAEPIIRAGACDRVLGAEDVAEALRAWFTPCSILECAELQFRLGELLDEALRFCETRLGNVRLLDPGGDGLHIVVHRGFDRRVVDRFAIVRREQESASARALRLHSRVVIEDVEGDPQYASCIEAARVSGYRAVQSTPLFAANARMAGVLSTHFMTPHQLGPEEARMLDEVARSAAPYVTRFQEGGGG
jgi:GAF domain-containing protein